MAPFIILSIDWNFWGGPELIISKNPLLGLPKQLLIAHNAPFALAYPINCR